MAGEDVDPLLVDRIREGLASADLDRYGDLLAPDVKWGAHGQVASGCQNRNQVLAWYRRGRAAGVRGDVFEAFPVGDKVVIGMRVTGRDEAEAVDGSVERWQVLTIRDGLIADIRGFEEREAALATTSA